MSRAELERGFRDVVGEGVTLERIVTTPTGIEFHARHDQTGWTHTIIIARPKGQLVSLGRQAGDAFKEWLEHKIERQNAE